MSGASSSSINPALGNDQAGGKHTALSLFKQGCALALRDRSQGVHARAAGRGPDGPLGDRSGRFGARMSVSVKETAPPAVALAAQQHGALWILLSRVLPPGLARRVLAAGDADRRRIERDLHDGVGDVGQGSRSPRARAESSSSAATRTRARY